MSHEEPLELEPDERVMRVCIVASEYNRRYTGGLLRNCRDELRSIAPQAHVREIRVPGAFEIPVMVNRELAKAAETRPDVVIALGVIIRGSTAHADLIGEAITRELLRAACDARVPVIHEVLLLQNEQQAEERCVGERLNRGREAARAALAMYRVIRDQ